MLKIFYYSILTTICFFSSVSVFSETLYSINVDTDELVKIDFPSGNVNVIGSLGLDVTAPNLAFLNNTLFAVDSDYANQKIKLIKINTSSGVATLLGDLSLNGTKITSAEGLAVKNNKLVVAFTTGLNNPHSTILGDISSNGQISATNDIGIDMDALTNNKSGKLFAIDSLPSINKNKLYSITPTSLIGSHTRNGGLNAINDLAFIGSELYGLAQTKLIKVGISNGNLIKIIPLKKTGTYLGLITKEVKTCKAINDSVSTVKNTIVTTSSVLLNDTDTNGSTLVVTSVDNRSSKGATITNNNDGTFTYTPKIDFIGNDSFEYVISDNNGCSDTGLVYVNVTKPSTNSSGGGSFSINGMLVLLLLILIGVRKYLNLSTLKNN